MVILLNEDSEFRKHYLAFARELINYFVINSKHLYTNSFCVYNVHCLLHICDDVVKCSLNDISCFPFENYMQTLKKAVKNSKSPVVQIAKQYQSIQSMLNTKSRKLKVSVKLNNSCFYIGENQFCFVDLSSGFFKCRIFRLDLQNDFTTYSV